MVAVSAQWNLEPWFAERVRPVTLAPAAPQSTALFCHIVKGTVARDSRGRQQGAYVAFLVAALGVMTPMDWRGEVILAERPIHVRVRSMVGCGDDSDDKVLSGFEALYLKQIKGGDCETAP